jgi:hypothetical protein
MSKIALSGNASGTGTFTFAAPGTNTDRTLTLPDASGTVATTADIPSVNPFTLGTAVASTSGTAIDFTGIPSWAKRVTVMFDGVSWAADPGRPRFRIGDSGGIEDTGYSTASLSARLSTLTSSAFIDGLYLTASFSYDATSTFSGTIVLTNLNGNTWTMSGNIAVLGTASGPHSCGGVKTLSGTLDRVRLDTFAAATFDAGTINISYEG